MKQQAGDLKQFKRKVKEKWDEFTDDDLDQIAGTPLILFGKVHEKFSKPRHTPKGIDMD